MQAIERMTLTVAETAELLGVCQMTIYRLCKKKQIPHHTIGNKIVFNQETLMAWFQEREVKMEMV
jgi:excisionase family DNA binding protein